MHGQRILITGLSRPWGTELAGRLESDPRVAAVVGIDTDPPAVELSRTHYVRADLRRTLLGRVIRDLGIDTVVHTDVLVEPSRTQRRGGLHENNVVGTMNLLAACGGSDSPVRRLVVRSTTAVYGSRPDDPSLWTEGMEPRTAPDDIHSRDAVEVESYVAEYSLRRPACTTTVLRFADVVGPTLAGLLGETLRLPVIPAVFGFDPRLQVVDDQDALAILTAATLEDHGGTFNVAGRGIVTLSQAAALMDRPLVPLLPPYGAPSAAALLRRMGVLDWPPYLARLMQFGRAVDIAALRREFAILPRSSVEAVRTFASSAAGAREVAAGSA